MANFSTSVVQPNEVVKAEDFTYGFDSLINNVSLSLAMALEARQDFVINGKVKPYAAGGMAVSIQPVFGLCYATGVPFGDTAVIEPVSIPRASEQDRIDIIQIQGGYQEYDEQQREFFDFETKIRTFQTVFTKKRMVVRVSVKQGLPGSIAAPFTDDGFVKLAEIHLPAHITDITEAHIKNINSDIQGLDNSEWTNEKSKTFNIGYLSDVNKRFRNEHTAEGKHKKKIIGIDHINTGSESGQVSGLNIPVGSEIPINTEKIGATVSLLESLKVISGKITDLFTAYLKYGAFNFKGELSVSSIINESNALVNALSIGADGEGTAVFKIGNRLIFTITKDGILRMESGYTANTKTDLITKAVTDVISSNLKSLSDDFEEFKRTTEYTVYSNSVLSRFSIGETLYAATTANISLSGLQVIDGVPLSAGVLVLVKNQNDLKQNGIYEVNANNWQRHSSYTADSGLKHKFFLITNGALNKGHLYFTPKESFIVDTDEIPFEDSIYAIEALASKIILRDASGRAKIAAPAAADDIARKDTVDNEATARTAADKAHADATTVHGGTNAATANRLILRDASGRAKIAAPAAADDIARKDTVDAEATARSNADTAHANSNSVHQALIINIAHPVDSTYIQFPGYPSPQDLFPGTLWENISSKFSGAFFRAEGIGALGFGKDRQTQSVISHSHGVSIPGLSYSYHSAGSNWVTVEKSGARPSGGYAFTGNSGVSGTTGGAYVNSGAAGGSGTWPDNFTIRIFRRES